MHCPEIFQSRIKEQYQKQGIKVETGDCWVVDTRNKFLSGPYSQDKAKKFAFDMNEFVTRNANITTNPFAVITAEGEVLSGTLSA